MTRRTIRLLVVTFALSFLWGLLTTQAQPPGRVPRIGVLVFQSAQTAAPFLEALPAGSP